MLSLLQQKEHINLLEMKAVHLALSHFRTTLHLKSLVLATDYYRSSLSEKPGRHSLFQPVFSLQGDSPSLLGTSDSTGSEAYSGSSQCTSRHTVSLSSTSEHGMGITTSNVQCISLLWGRPHLDLFATSLNHKLDTFASSVPDPLAYAVDAMSISWKGMFSYAFPPFRFLSQVLQKVARESCKIILL